MCENAYFTKTSDVRQILFAIGYPEGLPDPCIKIGKCGVSTLLSETRDHYVIVFRFCNCEKKPDRFYEALLLSKESNSYVHAFLAFFDIIHRNNISLDSCLPADLPEPVNN